MLSMNLILLIVFVFVCYTRAACPSTTSKPDDMKNELICEHNKVQLSCPTGQTILIFSATYGRTDASTCYDVCVSYYSGNVAYCRKVTTNNSLCTSNAQAKYKSNCDGKNSCTAFADNSVFGDPCVGTWKYSRIQWKCQ